MDSESVFRNIQFKKQMCTFGRFFTRNLVTRPFSRSTLKTCISAAANNCISTVKTGINSLRKTAYSLCWTQTDTITIQTQTYPYFRRVILCFYVRTSHDLIHAAPGGSEGGGGTRDAPLGLNFFIGPTQGLAHTLLEILDPPLSTLTWTSMCVDVCLFVRINKICRREFLLVLLNICHSHSS